MPLTNLARLFLAFPGSIRPADPDYTRCDPHYGQDLVGDACRVAVSKMPSLPRGVQAEWAVNHRQAITGWSRGSSYNLPLTITHEGCAVSIEAAGPKAYYDLSTPVMIPYTISSSPHQLRGIAATIVRECVLREHDPNPTGAAVGNGGYATDGMINLVNFLLDESTNIDGGYPTSTSFITVTVGGVNKNKSPGNFDPSIAVLIAGYLSQRQRDTFGPARKRLSNVIRGFSARAQKMSAGGRTQPFWQPVQHSLEEMSYDCDSALGKPAEMDCAQVEWGELGADDDSFSVGPGLTKILASNTCHLTISAAITTLIYWRQVRVALDTLLNVCLNGPIARQQSGGTAYVGGHTGVSGGIWGRQVGDESQNYSNGNLTGLNALDGAPAVNVTVSAQPLPGS